LELTGCVAEYIIKEKRAKGGAAVTPYSTHKTPFNPIFNPRYAPTDTKKALATRGSDAAPSTGKATGGKEWHLTKSKELAELEAALKTMPPPQQQQPRSGRATPSLATSSSKAAAPAAPVTGKKRKHDDDNAVTPAEHPTAKRQPSTTPYANTLELRRAILRRPGQPKPPAGPSRLGRSSTPATTGVPATENKEQNPPSTMRSTKKVKFSPSPMVAPANATAANRTQMNNNTPFGSQNAVVDTSTPNGSIARRPTMRAVSSGKSRFSGAGGSSSGAVRNKSSKSSLRVAAAIRATQAHQAYIARMRKAQKT
jgi:hypothetical protein